MIHAPQVVQLLGKFLTGLGQILISHARADPILENRAHKPGIGVARIQVVSVNPTDAIKITFCCNKQRFLDLGDSFSGEEVVIVIQRNEPGTAHEVANVGIPLN